MDGFGYKLNLKNVSLYAKFKDKIKFFPGTVVVAKCSPPGIIDTDLSGSIFIVTDVCLSLDKSDNLKDDEPQPYNLPYYYCRNSSWNGIVFDGDELEAATTPQIINLLKIGLLNNGHIPSRWNEDYYKVNIYK
jgi:hypothetical protein